MDQSLTPNAPSVLIVDDNKDAADMLAEVLETIGFNAIAAYDGEEGFRLAEQLCPDIALLDLSMPGVDGLDLCRRIRHQAWGSEMRIIAVSGLTLPDDRDAAVGSGCDDYLVKPFSLDDLVLAISVTLPQAESSFTGKFFKANRK